MRQNAWPRNERKAMAVIGWLAGYAIDQQRSKKTGQSLCVSALACRMDLPARTLLAFAIIGGITLMAGIVWVATSRKRKADKLRRRGIKSYNRRT
ncbi:hypothetical protein [Sphingomonas sp. Leaf17]|uniref:hypothetical protein n=1 Tax=Sphingomonas sp. Leaf17 TaxID=1735683 RepID=UPI00138EF9D7|nr:hypothetical protein [Sphingomonas sp. Leaf17]